ncbi:MAG: GTP-binding protein [Atopobiaceae bacterium]|jgi:G3E family GTPase
MTEVVVLAGERGSGKTTLINTLVAASVFDEPPTVFECETGTRTIDWDLVSDGRVALWPVKPNQDTEGEKSHEKNLQVSLTTIMSTVAPRTIIIEAWSAASAKDIVRIVHAVAESYPMEISAAITLVDGHDLAEIPSTSSGLSHLVSDASFIALVKCDDLSDFMLFRIRGVIHAFSNAPVVTYGKRSDVARLLRLAEVAWTLSQFDAE